MSVLKNHRHLSPIEYERKFDIFVRYLDKRLMHVPMRYYRELIVPFHDAINHCQHEMAEVTKLSFDSKKRISAERYKAMKRLLDSMQDIAKMSYVYWSISETKASIKYVELHSRKFWSDSFNEIVNLISKEAKKCHTYKEDDVNAYLMFPYPHKDKAQYLQAIDKLHKTIIGVSKRITHRLKQRNVTLLLDLCDDAMYEAYTANQIEIIDECTQKKRVRKLDKTIGLLYEMNKPLRELAFDHIFTCEELATFNETLEDAKKMTQAIRNKDKEIQFF